MQGGVVEREPFGRRVAARRQRAQLTQQRLAERIAISRTALSHIEAGLALASERTVTLLAGVFGVDPHELVADTDYPTAKADRLPLTAARYTEVDLQLQLMATDLRWCDELRSDEITSQTVQKWLGVLARLHRASSDPDDRARLDEARRQLRRYVDS